MIVDYVKLKETDGVVKACIILLIEPCSCFLSNDITLKPKISYDQSTLVVYRIRIYIFPYNIFSMIEIIYFSSLCS